MSEVLKKNNRPFISMLRIFAAFAVVVIHTRSLANYETPTYNFVYAVVLWSVPAFFMITGYIFLGIKQNVQYGDIKKNIFRFLVVLVVLGMFFALSERVFVERAFNIKMLYYAFLDVIQGNLFDHMWYLYEIIGLYLLLPVFSALLNNNAKNLYIFTCLLFFINILIPEILSCFDLSFGLKLSIGKYSLYLFLGAAMYHIDEKTSKKMFIPAIFVLALIVSYQAYMSFALRLMIDLSYVRSYVVLMSCCVFCIFKNLFDKDVFNNRFINELAGCTWGIYLFHPYVIHIFDKLFKISIVEYNNFVAFPVCCVLIFAISALVTFVLRKIHFINRFL